LIIYRRMSILRVNSRLDPTPQQRKHLTCRTEVRVVVHAASALPVPGLLGFRSSRGQATVLQAAAA